MVEGGIATVIYVGDGHRSGTRYEIVDVRDPTAPAFLSSLGHDSRIPVGAMVRTGQFLIVQESDAAGRPTLNTYDFSEPSRPLRVASLPMAGIITDMAVDGSRLALIHKPQAPVPPEAEPRVEIYNIADPAKPARVADIDFQAVGIGEFAIPPSQIEFADDTVFIAALAWNRPEKPFQLHAFDVADPTAPRHLATLALPMSPTDLIVQDGYLFAITQCSSPAAAGCSIVIVDVRDPANSRIAGQLPGASGAAEANPEVRKSPNSVAVGHGLVYVASGAAGIYVYRPRLDWPPEAGVLPLQTIYLPMDLKSHELR
ncbi:MAG: hypothetical protein ACKVP6_13730 [Mycobacterium sp.]